MENNSKFAKYWETFHYYLGTYQKIFGILVIIALMWNAYEVSTVRAEFTGVKHEVKQCNEYGIAVSDGMTIKGFKKQKINKNSYKFFIANIIKDSLVVSKNDLTIRSGVESYENWQALFESQGGIGGLKDFAEKHINHQSRNSQEIKFKEMGRASFLKFLKELVILNNKNKMPTAKDTFAINPRDIAYSVKDDLFTIKVKIHMKAAGLTGDGYKYYNRNTFAMFTLKGYISEDQSDPIINPNGIYFYDFDITPAINPKARTLKNKLARKQRAAKAKARAKKRAEAVMNLKKEAKKKEGRY